LKFGTAGIFFRLENIIGNEDKTLAPARSVLPLIHLPMEKAFITIPLHRLFEELDPADLRPSLPSYFRPQPFC